MLFFNADVTLGLMPFDVSRRHGLHPCRAKRGRSGEAGSTRRTGAPMSATIRRVLVIEDDPETARQVADCLTGGGYSVDLAADGEKGLSLGRTHAHVVITLDRMLPRLDGIELLRRLREEGIVTPALILSTLGEIDDRVRGLRAGGDDYLVKPFAFSEMLARVDALNRRRVVFVQDAVL